MMTAQMLRDEIRDASFIESSEADFIKQEAADVLTHTSERGEACRVVARRARDEERRLLSVRSHLRQDAQACFVNPLHVVEEQEDTLVLRERDDEVCKRLVKLLLSHDDRCVATDFVWDQPAKS